MTVIAENDTLDFADLPRLMALMTGDEKHDFAAESTLDVLWVLYDQILRVSPKTAQDPGRDRFLLSKGHGPMAYYAVLAAKGFIGLDELPGYGDFASRLGHHPDRNLITGVEIASGSLGHGLPLAVGVALGLRARRQLATGPAAGRPGAPPRPRVFVLVGDGELDEGSNHEAIEYAAAAGLDQLTVVLVDNSSSTHGWPGGAESRFAVAGWQANRVDGRDHAALAAALAPAHPGRPGIVVAEIAQKG
jgi:transketolase